MLIAREEHHDVNAGQVPRTSDARKELEVGMLLVTQDDSLRRKEGTWDGSPK